MTRKQTYTPPKEGWKPSTWYLVKIAVNNNNPVHFALAFSGFLDKEGQPAEYSGVVPCNYANREHPIAINTLRYFEVVREILNTSDLKNDYVLPHEMEYRNRRKNEMPKV